MSLCSGNFGIRPDGLPVNMGIKQSLCIFQRLKNTITSDTHLVHYDDYMDNDIIYNDNCVTLLGNTVGQRPIKPYST